tara:strand:- start:924 stop:1184 length:261 start_codon:yes stop_codon:yes gene_type:complete
VPQKIEFNLFEQGKSLVNLSQKSLPVGKDLARFVVLIPLPSKIKMEVFRCLARNVTEMAHPVRLVPNVTQQFPQESLVENAVQALL